MISAGDFIIPFIMLCIVLHGLWNDVDIFELFIEGAAEGLSVIVDILPSLIALLTAVGMFKASGALDLFAFAAKPLADMVHLPVELLPLAILRPVSGSGALAIFQDILSTYGPDSYIGRVASVLEGSSETTFYTIAVYFGATKVSNTRHALPSSLCADIAGFVMSGITVSLLMQ
ncbi:MAG: spore maturation protein [Oscillospiraceae bacterium]|nr:spore maturation protein [Oscillospiraceae bacterium]